MIESVDGIYVNIFFYNPLAGSSYIKLPEELRKSRKILINIKKKKMINDFAGCHIRLLNPMRKNRQLITKSTKKNDSKP